MGFHGADGKLEHPCGFDVREAGAEAERDNGAFVFGKFQHREFEVVLKITAARGGIDAAGVGIVIERLVVAAAARVRKDPDDNAGDPYEQRNHAHAPEGIMGGEEKGHKANAHREQDDPAAQIAAGFGPSPRIEKQLRRNRLPFFNHQADRFMGEPPLAFPETNPQSDDFIYLDASSVVFGFKNYGQPVAGKEKCRLVTDQLSRDLILPMSCRIVTHGQDAHATG